jgi:hypothetical protein
MKRLFQQLVAQYRLYASAPQLQAKVAELEARLDVSRNANAELLNAGIANNVLFAEREMERRRANTAEATLTRLRTVLNDYIGPLEVGPGRGAE